MNNFSIGLLEYGYRDSSNSLSIIQEVIDYAVRADELGFSRFWLTEHHDNDKLLPYTNPETLLTLIAGMTEQIRLGAAGILIKIHNPYFTATNFKLLNNLFHNRIDLGFAKTSPDNQYIMKHLYDSSDKDLFNKQIGEVFDLLENEKKHFDTSEIVLPPYGGITPELWYLSNSYRNFPDAIKYRMNYCRSLIHGKNLLNINYNKEELNGYKQTFYEINGYLPKVTLAVGVSITNDKGNLTSNNTYLKPVSVHSSIIPIPSYNYLYNLFHEFQEQYGIDEFIIWDTEGNSIKKLENIEAISSMFNLNKELVNEVEENI